jgi:hypothetical protein
MDVAAENNGGEREHAEAESDTPCTEATFTKIYELILHNQSLVSSELEVLQQLIQKKLIKKGKTTPAEPRVICGRFDGRRLGKNIYSSCCVCKKVRTDDYGSAKDKWREVEDFLKEEMDILLSSTYCPKCAQTVQEDLQVHIDRLKA